MLTIALSSDHGEHIIFSTLLINIVRYCMKQVSEIQTNL